jgi:hypothetical protein
MSVHRFGADTVECRLEFNKNGDWAEVYAQAGPNFPLYEDEKYVGDVPLTFLNEYNLKDVDGTVSIPRNLFNEIRSQSECGWGDD